MIAADSNILVYAHRKDSPWHAEADQRIRSLATGKARWTIPWPCIHEFLNIVTHPRIYTPPSTLTQAVEQVDAWLESPGLVMTNEPDDYWKHLSSLLAAARVSGPKIHDARIAAICRAHGVIELWTADRDFSRFPALRTRNPLIADG